MADLIHVATRKGLFAVRNKGDMWLHELIGFTGDPVSQVLQTSDGTLYAALNLGHFGVKLHRSADGGRTWEEIAAPALPEDASDDLAVELIWCLEETGTGTGHLWAGTIPGGLFRSEDGGESWTLNRPLWDMPDRKRWWGGGYDQPGIHSIAVDPRDTNHVTVAVSVGGVWQTFDGGETWRVTCKGLAADYLPPDEAEDGAQQDPHRLVACASAPDKMWIQHHCGIWRSVDTGETWQTVTAEAPSRFGFAVAVHPNDPDTAWFVPAVKDECRIPVDGNFVAMRTTDGGQSFTILDHGLPQDTAWDLVYRHALDIDATGKQLAMGSTTGGLWVTQDGGDKWQMVSAHLPPIAAVRFAGA
jgi:photosystem II stability/assembly factor-like uncharacterized protein